MSRLMVPWLHFTGGDILFFQSWRPSSKAALAGASVALLLLAVLERFLSAVRAVFAQRWRHHALAIKTSRPPPRENRKAPSDSGQEKTRDKPPHDVLPRAVMRRENGVNVPFVLAYDLPRGVLYALQVLLGYLLMLAVMTFQVAYLIAIILGLGIGETLFARVGGTRGH